MISDQYRLFDLAKGVEVSTDMTVCAMPGNALSVAGANGEGGLDNLDAYADQYGSVELFDPTMNYRTVSTKNLPERGYFAYDDEGYWSNLSDLRVVDASQIENDDTDFSDPTNRQVTRQMVQRFGEYPTVDESVTSLRGEPYEDILPLPRWYEAPEPV